VATGEEEEEEEEEESEVRIDSEGEVAEKDATEEEEGLTQRAATAAGEIEGTDGATGWTGSDTEGSEETTKGKAGRDK
jgi:hypothetical protein